ncbi:MAG: hypothetical protein L6Q97_27065 [Thermoanaerobaculia bacterium]|nr:hypothetical protein [Thermoanaerobaculia bacterium]
MATLSGSILLLIHFLRPCNGFQISISIGIAGLTCRCSPHYASTNSPHCAANHASYRDARGSARRPADYCACRAANRCAQRPTGSSPGPGPVNRSIGSCYCAAFSSLLGKRRSRDEHREKEH